jgi:hypothetical protein
MDEYRIELSKNGSPRLLTPEGGEMKSVFNLRLELVGDVAFAHFSVPVVVHRKVG